MGKSSTKPEKKVKASKTEEKPAAAVEKKEKKSKKSKKEPTPPPPPSSSSSSSSDSESDSDSSSSDSEDDKPVTAIVAEKATKVAKDAAKKVAEVAAKVAESSDSDSDSDSSDDEKPAPKAAEAKKAESSSSDSDSDSEDEKPAAKTNGKAEAKKEESSDSSDSDSDSDSSSDDEEEKKEAPKPAATESKKRSAPEDETVTKKAKVDESASHEAAGSTTVYVGGLSWNVDNEWLKSEMEVCGEVVSARVVTDRESGKSRGFGYVEFTKPEFALKALEMAGNEIDGRAIKVDLSQPRPNREQAPKKVFNDTLSGPPTTTLFVGNLPFSATEDAVWAAFADFGDVSSVRLPTDAESGRPKGFGYVEFSSLDAAIAAVEKGGPTASGDGVNIEGRTVRLDYSQPRADRQAGGGGRGGGFGGRGGRGGDRGGRGGRGGSRGGRGSFGGNSRGGDSGWGSRAGSARSGGAAQFEGKKMTF